MRRCSLLRKRGLTKLGAIAVFKNFELCNNTEKLKLYPDIVILDIQMREMDGFEIANTL
jgi:CheY-like chemotaxis protein